MDSAPATKPTTSVKLVLLGEAAVGKSSLVLRFVSDDFQENKGAAFLTQKCALPNRTIKFEIWDTAGQERFASLAPMYYRNAQSALVVYDVTKPASFVKARHWVNELKAQASPGIVIALVGNKVDLVESDGEAEGEEESESARKVAVEEGKALAENEELLFFETSAKSGLNVRQVFLAIANKIPQESGRRVAAAVGSGRSGAEAGGRVDLNANPSSSSSPSACNC